MKQRDKTQTTRRTVMKDKVVRSKAVSKNGVEEM